MELIKEAIRKAKAASPQPSGSEHYDRALPELGSGPEHHDRPPPGLGKELAHPASGPTGWTPPEVHPSVAHLERHRIVSSAMDDPSHVAFNLLRTKIFKSLKDNGWRSVAITSPTAGCGKTMVAINLAFSLARQPACKTVLIDLDLKKSAVGQTMGINAGKSIGQYLEGQAAFEECFVRIGDQLVLGLNNHYVENSAELMHDQRLKNMLQRVTDTLAPAIVLFDLPPMLSTDEALAFLPQVDTSILVVAAGQTTVPQVDECERHLRAGNGYLGVVLNKSSHMSEKYYYDKK